MSTGRPPQDLTPTPVPTDTLRQIVEGGHHSPHDVLGAHPDGTTLTIRSLRPLAQTVSVRIDDVDHPMTHEYGGIWVVAIDSPVPVDYRLVVTYGNGGPSVVDDPYRFLPTLGDVDQHLIREGRHERLWEVLGAHVHRYPTSEHTGAEVTGTAFAVWAPAARGVRVLGDFNHWSGQAHPMRSLGASGVWELFVPEVGAGTHYKYAVCGADGRWRIKADPMASWTQVPPETASRVFESTYVWADGEWLAHRAATPAHDHAMSVYEVHLGSWRQGRGYRQLADELADYVADLGFTHVEFLPVMEHPFGGSWGYQVTGYYAPTSRFGDPDDFRYLVDKLHQRGIGVLLDWVPAHFPKDEWALARFDGTPLYEHGDPRRGEQLDWGTYVFDYGRSEVRNFLVANALYWLHEFHIDGLRVDAVASMIYLDYSREEGGWVPNVNGGRENLEAVALLQEVNATAYKTVPGIVTIAEESTAWPGVTRPTDTGGLGFGLKWNMGWMHDTLGYLAHDPIHRRYHHNEMTFPLVYAFTENFVLPLSHDEVVHGKGSLLRKMPGDRWRQLATLRSYLAFMWASPGKQLIFMGAELGQESEWSESRDLDWWLLDLPDHAGLQRLVRDLNTTYRDLPALWSQDADASAFTWLVADDSDANVFAFARFGSDGSVLACIANFSPVPHDRYKLGLPRAGVWTERLNSDAGTYAGTGVGNMGQVVATADPHRGQPASTTMQVPPLGTVWLSWSGT
jgi:1,4-alpha-glucan branching enzyme